MSNPPAKVLVADDRDAIEAFRRALTGTFELIPVGSVQEAMRVMRDPPALVVCGCHFDEGGMYDLLRQMKASPALDRIPFMAVRCLEGELDDTLYESVKIAVRALGGNAFVDLLRWQRKYGEAQASSRLTALVAQLAQQPHHDAP
ncbi:MAG: hypothetical protein EOO24_36660 [Comamonadaceae bacterium]|nr:MAG: hypothetical protein EOO24_36660 [Comamonadaceae bacterium]